MLRLVNSAMVKCIMHYSSIDQLLYVSLHTVWYNYEDN